MHILKQYIIKAVSHYIFSLCSEEAVTFENNENCSNNQKDNKKEIKSSNYGTKGNRDLQRD